MPPSREAAPDLPTPDAPAPDPPAPDRPVLRVREPGELVSSIPLVMGFHPRDSLVLISGGGPSSRRLGLMVRVDLPLPEHESLMAESVVSSLLRDKRSGAAVIVVGSGEPGRQRRELVELVQAELGRHDVDTHTTIWTEGTTAGSRWECYDGCCGGVLPDPSVLPHAASVVLNGQVVYADRAELERVVEPTDPQAIRRREIRLIEVVDQASEYRDALTDFDTADAAIAQAVADAAAGRLALDDEAVVELAVALAAPEVRDAAIRHCTGDDSAAAEQLWAALTRETPDPEAAEPAAMLAVSALMRGDGALANVAIDRAERAWPGHRLARLMRAVAEAGISPSELRTTWMIPVPRRSPSGDAAPGSCAPRARQQPTSRSRGRRNRKPGDGSR